MMSVCLLLVLKISLICLKVSQELERLATSLFFSPLSWSSFSRLERPCFSLGSFYLENIFRRTAKLPFD